MSSLRPYRELVFIILFIVSDPYWIHAAFTTPSFWTILAAVFMPIVTVQAIIRYIQHRRSQ